MPTMQDEIGLAFPITSAVRPSSSCSTANTATMGEMPLKGRLNAWKRISGVLSPANHGPIKSVEDQEHDEGLWDKNDDAFLQEIAWEKHHRRLHSPSPSDLEEVSSLTGSGSSHNPATTRATATSSPFSPLSQTSPPHFQRPSSAAGASHLTYGSFSASASDTSSALTYPSPGSSKVELGSRHRFSGHQFGSSHEASPTSPSFHGSREVGPNCFSSDKLQDGWTEELVPSPFRHEEPEFILSSLPEEQSPGSYRDSPQRRRPSTGSANFVSPRSKKMNGRDPERSPRLDSASATDYSSDRTPMAARSRVYHSSNKTSPASPSPRKPGIVSGIKKKLGNSLRSNKDSSKVTSSPSVEDTQKMQKADEVHIVSADPKYAAVPTDTLPDFASYAFPPRTIPATSVTASASQAPIPTSGSFSAPIIRRREEDAINAARRPSASKANDRRPSVESLSSRLFGKRRGSGAVISHSRNSSRSSVIEHISYEEARRPSDKLAVPPVVPRRPSTSAGTEEAREELQGEVSPMSKTRRVPSPLPPAPSPTRPSRDLEPSAYLPLGPLSSRASLEGNFNAAHDKRWSTITPSLLGERRGSEALSRTNSMRRGSETGPARSFIERRQRDSLSSTTSRRSSWQKNSFGDGLLPDRQSPHPLSSTSSLASYGQRASLMGQASHRLSGLFGVPLPRKHSLTSAQISRPTSIIGGSSAAFPDQITVESNCPSPTQRPVHRMKSQDGKGMTPSPLHITQQSSTRPRLPILRDTRSAGGRVEQAGSFSRSEASEDEVAFSQAKQLQKRGSQYLSSKRPTFGLDLQPDAAAAFDSIPSPNIRSFRTTSAPAPVDLRILTGRRESDKEGDGCDSGTQEVFPLTPDDDKSLEEEMYSREQELFLSAERKRLQMMEGSFDRPLALNTPHSPVQEELEVLDDAEDNSSNGLDSMGPSDVLTVPRIDNGDAMSSGTCTFTNPWRVNLHSPTSTSLSRSCSQDRPSWTELSSQKSSNGIDMAPHATYPHNRRSSYTFV